MDAHVRRATREHISSRPPFTFVSCSIPSVNHVERNEDNLIADQRRGLAAVFDGVGGSTAGEIASQIAARVIQGGWKRILQQLQQGGNVPTILQQCNDAYLHSALQQLIEETHEQIRSEGAQRKTAGEAQRSGSEDQATTLALAVFCQQREITGYLMMYAHVGDSRIYLLREGEVLKRLTSDDGYLAKMVDDQVLRQTDALRIDQATLPDQLSEAEMSYFNKRNGITQALGDQKKPIVHIDQTTVIPGDRILICTDGIHDNLTDLELEEILRQGAHTTVARKLVQCAVQRSHQESSVTMRAKADDMTALVVTCHY
jgi:PPM family protein phosphatase